MIKYQSSLPRHRSGFAVSSYTAVKLMRETRSSNIVKHDGMKTSEQSCVQPFRVIIRPVVFRQCY